MSLAGAIAGVTASINTLKALRTVEKAIDQAELKIQIADLISNLADAKVELVEAQQTLKEKDEEIVRLQASLERRASLIEGPGGHHWQDRGGGLKLGYPICPSCDERDGRQVQLKQSGLMHSAACPRCSSKFEPVEFFHEPDSSGAQKTETEVAKEKRARSMEALGRINSSSPWER